MLLRDILDVLQSIAPLQFAEAWDNVGLLVGDASQTVRKAILTIDYTDAVASEAKDNGCDLVIAYHPTLFKPIQRLTADRSTKLLLDAARRGVAIYSPHTAWDVALGGTNDVLADMLVIQHRRPLRLTSTSQSTSPSISPSISPTTATKHFKLVVFVPTDSTDAVASAVFNAGAGHIGRYDSCSFRTMGVGTFRGDATTNPTIGEPGKLERVGEVRLETVVPAAHLSAVLDAMKKSHPYEEVAFDVYPLHQAGERESTDHATGIGRVGTVPDGSTIEMMLNRVKRELGVERVLVAGPVDRPLKKAAVCAGAGGELLADAIAEKVDLYLTGELRHHDALRAVSSGVTVACVLHSNSERASLKALSQKLNQAIPSLPVQISTQDQDPFSIL
jgi:dinuclear metal center YbgI/SA1388 family protein